MAAINQGRVSKKSLLSQNVVSNSNILENVFGLSRDPTTLSFGAGNSNNNAGNYVNLDGRAETGRFKGNLNKGQEDNTKQKAVNGT